MGAPQVRTVRIHKPHRKGCHFCGHVPGVGEDFLQLNPHVLWYGGQDKLCETCGTAMLRAALEEEEEGDCESDG